jgi:hypothetical protein
MATWAAMAIRRFARRISTAWRARECGSRSSMRRRRSALPAVRLCSPAGCRPAAACAATSDGCCFPTRKEACPADEVTSARVLKTKGYATGLHRQVAPGASAAVPAHGARLRLLLRHSLFQRHGPRGQRPAWRAAFFEPKIEYWNVPLMRNKEESSSGRPTSTRSPAAMPRRRSVHSRAQGPAVLSLPAAHDAARAAVRFGGLRPARAAAACTAM